MKIIYVERHIFINNKRRLLSQKNINAKYVHNNAKLK